MPGYEYSLSERIMPFPRLLQNVGYDTYSVGKWHLGMELENSPHAATAKALLVNSAHRYPFSQDRTRCQSRYNEIGELIEAPYFAVFQSSSVGSPRVTQYTNESANIDSALFDFDFILCQSQSNSGNQQSRPQAWAKNVISVGGVTHRDNSDRDDDGVSGASTGPAADGRIKPTVAHFYDSIFTPSTVGGHTRPTWTTAAL